MSTIHIIAGPTASGKSALALEKAAAMDGVIINADSMQVYNALPILTAQPSAADRAAAPHELYGFQDPNTWCSAGHWRDHVISVITPLLQAGTTPIIVGGSGLYIKCLLEGFSPVPAIPPAIRQSTIDRQIELGNPGFYEELKQRDPVMAARFHPHHTARLVRAYEVLEATGKSLAEFQALPLSGPPEGWEFDLTILTPPRDVLHRRCNDRFIWMMDNGAVEEIEAFDKAAKAGQINDDALIHRALGAHALRAWINGDLPKADAINQAQTETRQYAKRQTTWFKNQIKPHPAISRITRVE